MKIGLIGLPQSGKTTVFEALTSKEEDSSLQKKGFDISEIEVPDERLNFLARRFEPKKVTFPKIAFVDMQQVENGIDSKHLKDVDELSFVVRMFKDEIVSHPLSSLNPLRDVEMLNTGILLSDIDLIQRRVEKINQELKKGIKDNEKEFELLNKFLDKLEHGFPIRKLDLSKEEEKIVSGYKFLSQKPFLVVLNIDEGDLGNDKFPQELFKWTEEQNIKMIKFCAKLEKELIQLDEVERPEFMKELGIKEPALDKFIRTSYDTLDLISFFTVKGDETKAWSIKDGTTAWEAAGKIHSDIQRGFIKAEVIGLEDFKQCDSFKVAKEKGLLRLEGKDYIVRDGDIINFKFNV